MNTKLLLELLKGFNFWSIIMLIHKAGGASAVRRFLTIPEGVLKNMPTANIPGRLQTLVQERDEFVEEATEFLEACVDEDFIDPDPPASPDS